MKLFSSFFLFILILPASAIGELSSADKQAILATFKIEPRSILYMDRRLTLMYSATLSTGRTIRHWEAYDCHKNNTWQLYADIYQDDKVIRIYGQQYDLQIPRYAVPKLEDNFSQPQKLKYIQQMCTHPPVAESEWVIVKYVNSTPEEPGYTILVDRKNSFRPNNTILNVRLAYDYDNILSMPPYNAPYSMKVEDKYFACNVQKDWLSSSFYIDDKGFVTDHMLNNKIEAKIINDPIQLDIQSILCKVNDFNTYEGLGKPIARIKAVSSFKKQQLPDFANNRPDLLEQYLPSSDIEQYLNTLLQTNALKAKFTRLTFTQGKLEPRKTTIDVDEKGRTRTLKQLPGNLQIQSEGVANFFPQKLWFNVGPRPFITKKLHTTLQFPLTKGQHFTVARRFQDPEMKTLTMEQLMSCQVGLKFPAKTLNAYLPGNYWQIHCIEEIKIAEESEANIAATNYAYLEELGTFIPVEDTKPGKFQPWSISEVTLSR